MTDPLYEPIRLNRITVSNRIVMPARHLDMADDFQITERIVDFYEERAKGGAGMRRFGGFNPRRVAQREGTGSARRSVLVRLR